MSLIKNFQSQLSQLKEEPGLIQMTNESDVFPTAHMKMDAKKKLKLNPSAAHSFHFRLQKYWLGGFAKGYAISCPLEPPSTVNGNTTVFAWFLELPS